MPSWYTEEKKRAELDDLREQFSKRLDYVVRNDIESFEVSLECRDGAHLRTFVTRPIGEKSVPTILQRTCYPEADFLLKETANEYAKRGFGYVYQFCRGTGGSEGEWVPNINERNDGKDTIDWLNNQDWVKNIGYQGCSYTALTGWTIADILPEKVKTMYLAHYGLYRFVSAYQSGLFRHDILTGWAMWNAGFEISADYFESCKYRPHISVDEDLWGKRIDWYRQWITSTDASDEYWNSGFWGMLKEIPAKVKVPIYMVEGWYDHHLGSAIETYKSLNEEAKKHSTFLIGAWDHNFNIVTKQFPGSYYDNSDIIRSFDWFYELLVKNNIPEGMVKTYVCGDDTWIQRKEYGLKNQNYLNMFLANGKEMKLCKEKDSISSSLEYYYDPNDPQITHGSESCMCTEGIKGSIKQPEENYRKDVLSFVSDVLDDDYTVSGKITVNLTVSSDCEDSCFTAKVCEVLPNGETYNIRTGLTTLGYRNNTSERLLYYPNERVDISIEMWDIAWKLHKGSKVRVDISSSDFPQYSIHSNYPGCWALADKVKIAKQTVYVGKDSNSYVSFPLIKDTE